MTKIRAASIFMLLILFTAGCGNTVETAISEDYRRLNPYRVAVLPVIWEEKAADEAASVSYLARVMATEKLKAMNYSVVPLETVDEGFLKEGKAAFFKRPPSEIASMTGADALLYTRIIEWDKSSFAAYASLDIEASFELRSKDGVELWRANYATGDRDLRLDTESMELAVHKAYEARLQRFIDIVFKTLPMAEDPAGPRQFFQWLP